MSEIKNNTVALIGMTGCGKSSVGRILAKKLGARLVDLDDVISENHGEIKKIFAEQGEEAFRELEYGALHNVLTEKDGRLLVLSCGGGLVTYKKSRELLTGNTTVVWLRRSTDSVSKDPRVMERPPINGDIKNYDRLRRLRYPIYREAADFTFYNVFPQRAAANMIKKLFDGQIAEKSGEAGQDSTN